VKTSFGGLPPKEVCLLLDSTTMSWFAMIALIFHGRVFDKLRILSG
jgi:hypothetical protein